MSPRCPIAVAARTAPRASPDAKSPSINPSNTPAVKASPAPTRSSADALRAGWRRIFPFSHPMMSRPASDTTTHFAPVVFARFFAMSSASPPIFSARWASPFGQKTMSASDMIEFNFRRADSGVHNCAR